MRRILRASIRTLLHYDRIRPRPRNHHERDRPGKLLALNQSSSKPLSAATGKCMKTLCDPSITCFEPEARGQVVAGDDIS